MPGRIQGSNVKPLGELNPDFVLSVKYLVDEKGLPKEQSDQKFAKLIKSLTNVGFYSQVRPGEDSTLLVFIKVNDAILLKTLKSFHLKDYLYGVKNSIDDDEQILEHLSSAEKLRAAYSLISVPKFEGGAGITPGAGEWQFVEKIMPLYDSELTKRLVTEWSKKPLIDENDIATIKDIAGEKVALYFGFLRFYTVWLVVPSVLGFVSFVFFRRYSIVFTVLNLLWAILMINAWKKKENIYAITWNTKDSSFIETKRAEFEGETEEIDTVTGIKSPAFPAWKRTLRELAFLPVAVGAALTLVSYQFGCFFIEIFLNEIYQGSGKQFLSLVPTVLIVGFIPILTAIYTNIAVKFMAWENHETDTSYERSFTQKQFILNFLASYMPLFITSFVYLPFGHLVNPYLSFIQSHTSKYNITIQKSKFQINKERLNSQFAYFAVTAQVVGFFMENVVPVVIRKVTEYFRGKKDENSAVSLTDLPEEASFLKEVREQVALPPFNVNDEYREMVIQFGYLAIFSPVWSLAPIVSLINNWIEFRGDAYKLFNQTQRPIPVKTDSIAPWDSNLKVLVKIATLVAPAITVMFRQSDILEESAGSYMKSPVKIPAWTLLAVVLVSEHLSNGLNFFVESLYNNFGNKTERDFKSNVYKTRRQYIDGYLQQQSPSGEIEKRSVSIDPTEQYWENFSDDEVVKHASIIPKQVLDAVAFKKEKEAAEKEEARVLAEKKKAEAAKEKEIANAQSSNTSYQTYSENGESTLQSRSGKGAGPLAEGTTGAKAIHGTARVAGNVYGAGTVAAGAAAGAATVAAGAVAGAAGYGRDDETNAQPRSTAEGYPSSAHQDSTSSTSNRGNTSDAAIGTTNATGPAQTSQGHPTQSGAGVAGTGAVPNDTTTQRSVSSSTSSSTSRSSTGLGTGSAAGAGVAAGGLGASNVAGNRNSGAPADATSTSPSSSKKGGFLSKFKKDAPSIGKGAKADFAKNSDKFKGVANDVKKGDYNSAKQLAGEVKENPDEYIGNSKNAYQQSDLSKSGNKNTGTSSSNSGAATGAGVGAAGAAGATGASSGHNASGSTSGGHHTTPGSHAYGTGAGSAYGPGVAGAGIAVDHSSKATNPQAAHPSSHAASTGTANDTGGTGSETHETSGKHNYGTGAGAATGAGIAGAGIAVNHHNNETRQTEGKHSTSYPKSGDQNSTSYPSGTAGSTSTAHNDQSTTSRSTDSQSDSVNPYNAVPKDESSTHGKGAGVGLGAGAGAGAAGVAANSGSGNSGSKEEKKGGFFSKFSKKDATTLAKGAKEDATKLSGRAQGIAGDVRKGDYSSAKKLAMDVKEDPNQYIGNTKGAVDQVKAGQQSGGAVQDTSKGASQIPNESSSSGNHYGRDAAIGAGTVGAGAAGAGYANHESNEKSTSGATGKPSSSGPSHSSGPHQDSGLGSNTTTGTGAGTAAGGTAGATLPPNLDSSSHQSKSDAAGNKSTSSHSQGSTTGYTGAKSDPFASQPNQASNKSGSKGYTSAEDAEKGTKSTSSESHHGGKTAAGATTGAAVGAGAGAAASSSSNTRDTQNNPEGVRQKLSNPFTDGSQSHSQPSKPTTSSGDDDKKTLDPKSGSSGARSGSEGNYDTTSQPKPSKTAVNDDSHPHGTQGIDNQDQQGSGHGGVLGGAAAGVAGAAGAAGLANKFGGSGGSKEGSIPSGNQKLGSNLANEGGDSYLDNAKAYAQQHGTQINDYVQKAADKADDYAKTSDNQYIVQGNQYVQKFADKSDEYAKQQAEAEARGGTTDSTTTGSNKKSAQDPSGSAGAAAVKSSSGGKNSVPSNANGKTDSSSKTGSTGEAGSNGKTGSTVPAGASSGSTSGPSGSSTSEGKNDRAYSQFANKKHSASEDKEEDSGSLPQHFKHENKNPYTGQTGPVPGTEDQVIGAGGASSGSATKHSSGGHGDSLQPPKSSNGADSASTNSSTTSPRKKKGLLSKIKEKVKGDSAPSSADSTPKKGAAPQTHSA